eukprot:m.475902 g.475902  ORF g.475902 m.475902 type:complete len:124 (-) comp21687_c1_seq59:178-549(-)
MFQHMCDSFISLSIPVWRNTCPSVVVTCIWVCSVSTSVLVRYAIDSTVHNCCFDNSGVSVQLYPCSFGEKSTSLPEHVDMYSDDELQIIQESAADILEAFGYSFDMSTKQLSLAEPTIIMHNN